MAKRSQPHSSSRDRRQQQPDQNAPDAGGPTGDNGAIALPKKKDNPDAHCRPLRPSPNSKTPREWAT